MFTSNKYSEAQSFVDASLCLKWHNMSSDALQGVLNQSYSLLLISRDIKDLESIVILRYSTSPHAV